MKFLWKMSHTGNLVRKSRTSIWYSWTFLLAWPAPGRSFFRIWEGGRGAGGYCPPTSPQYSHFPPTTSPHKICVVPNWSYSAPHPPPWKFCVVPYWGYSAPHPPPWKFRVVPNSLNLAPHKYLRGRGVKGNVVPNSFFVFFLACWQIDKFETHV